MGDDDIVDLLLSPPIILCVVMVIIMFLIPLLCRRFFCNVIKTLPRDLKGAVRYGKLIVHLWLEKIRNRSVAQVFTSTVSKHPNKVCFYYEEQEWTFRQVEDMANRVANYFSKAGFVKGDTIALFMENRPEYVCIWLGLSKIGVIPALINFNLRLKPLQHSFDVVNCKALIYGYELQEAVSEACDKGGFVGTSLYCFGSGGKNLLEYAIDLDKGIQESLGTPPTVKESVSFNDNLYYIYTSGTTGLPKAAIIKHSRFFMIAYGGYFMQGLEAEDILYVPLPIYHTAGGTVGIGQALGFGITVALRKKFSASNFWKDCVKYNVTVAMYIGEICRYLISQPPSEFDTTHKIRLMFGNGLRPEIWQPFLDRFGIPSMGELYGATEGNCNLGDVLFMDELGYFFFKDRTGDTFRWKGENVSTAEVEAVISSIMGLKDAVVYGVLVPGLEGKAGMAAIADTDGSVDLDVLADGLQKQLPVYARPIFVRVLKEINMTGTYKLKKLDLQNEGFNIHSIKDNMYYYNGSKYIPLDATVFELIQSGRMRL